MRNVDDNSIISGPNKIALNQNGKQLSKINDIIYKYGIIDDQKHCC